MTGLTASILGVTGEVVDLSTAPLLLAGSPGLFGVAPVTVGSTATPALSAGSRRGKTRASEWPLVVPIRINADTQQGLLEEIEHLSRLVDPRRGDCVIQVTRPDGEQREIVGHYSGGLTPTIEYCTSNTSLVDVIFRCPHPFWRATAPASVTLDFPVSGSGLSATPFSDDSIPFSDPATPFNGWASSSEEGTVLATLTNVGSAPAWPLWRFAGPIASVEVANLTTGRAWSWSRAPWSELAAGQTLEVRTAEQSDAVRIVDGENRYRGLSTARDLFPLETGDNLVLVQVTGAGSETTASVEFHPEWLTC